MLGLVLGSRWAFGAEVPISSASAPADERLARWAPSEPAVVRARAAALLLSGQQGGTVRVALLVIPAAEAAAPPATGGAAVVVLAEIDGGPLVAEGQAEGVVEIFQYVLSADGGEVLAVDSRLVRWAARRHGEILRRGGLKVVSRFDLAPGEHQLRTLVRSGETAFGLWTTRLLVPAPEAGSRPATGARRDDGWAPPLFAEAAESWLRVAAPDGAGAGPLPAFEGEEGLLPAARPVLRPTAALRVSLPGSAGLPASARPRLVFQPLAEGAEGAREIPLVPLGATSWSFDGRGLAAGPYRVHWTAEGKGGVGTSGWLTLWVDPEGAPAWPRLERSLDGEAAPPAPGVEISAVGEAPASPRNDDRGRASGAAAAGERRALELAYRALLGRAATEGTEVAYADLLALERAASASHGDQAQANLEAAQKAVLTPLASSACGCLMPIFRLHGLAAERYPSQFGVLASHALAMAAWVAEASAAGAEPGSAEALAAARALAVLADRTARQGQDRRAELLYARALALAPAEQGIRLSLAALHEKYGRYAEAVAALEPALDGGSKASPSAEPRLRLAINLARLDRGRRARRLLAGLVAEGGRDWTRLVAYQELARIRREAGDLTQARGLLREAMALWPGDPGLTVQRAHLELLRGERDESRRLLLGLERGAGTGEATARDRYNRWPTAAPAEGRRQVDEVAELQRPRLAETLALSAGARRGEPAR